MAKFPRCLDRPMRLKIPARNPRYLDRFMQVRYRVVVAVIKVLSENKKTAYELPLIYS